MAAYTTSETPAGKRRWSGHDLRESLKGAVRIRQSHRCAYCWKLTQRGHIDHVIPRAAGGSNRADNLVYACRECNLNKADQDLAAFLARRPKVLARVQSILAVPVDRVAGREWAARRAEIKQALQGWVS